MQKVLIVDDSALMRRKICDIINTDKDFQVSEMSMNTQDAYNKIVENAYAIVVIGLSARMDVLTFSATKLQTLRRTARASSFDVFHCGRYANHPSGDEPETMIMYRRTACMV